MSSRRDFLRTGASALTAAASGLLPRSLRAAGAVPAAPNVILVAVSGGWDVTYALDPKPGSPAVDAPAGAVQLFGGIPIFTHASRPNVTSFFEAWGGVSAVVNGVQVRSVVHPYCMRRMLTGNGGESAPDFGAITGFSHGIDRPVPYLVLGSTSFPGQLAASTAQVGFTKQVKALLDPAEAYSPPRFVPNPDDEAGIRKFVEASIARERAVRGSLAHNATCLDQLEAGLLSGDLLRESRDDLGPRNVALATADQFGLAVTAIERGLSSAVATQDNGGAFGWDTHGDNAPQGQYHDSLFQALKGLADTLSTRPGSTSGSVLLDETLVVVLSEMSRTPRLNETGGKDHWPLTSVLMFGAGVAGGTVCGATDDTLTAKKVNISTGAVDANGDYLLAEHVVAGVLEVAGVDPSLWLPGTEVLRGFAS